MKIKVVVISMLPHVMNLKSTSSGVSFIRACNISSEGDIIQQRFHSCRSEIIIGGEKKIREKINSTEI